MAVPRQDAVGRVGATTISLEMVLREALGVSDTSAWLRQYGPELQRLLADDYRLLNVAESDGDGPAMLQHTPRLAKEDARAIQATLRAHMMMPPTDEGSHPQRDVSGLQVSMLQVANSLWALGKLRYNKHPALASLAALICERQQELTAREVANCTWAAGQLYLTHGGLYDALLVQALHHLRKDTEGEMEGQHLGQIARGLGACAGTGRSE